jgi:Putative zinc-finger
MTDMLCGYTDRDETIVAYLYNDIDPAERRVFQQHLLTCTTCRDEVAAFKTVQKQLAQWDPPLPASIANREINSHSAIGTPQSSSWWREIPAWAQVAAALLFLGVSAGVANLDVHYDATGLSVKTGWSGRSGSARSGESAPLAIANGSQDAPWRADLARMEQQLKSEMRAAAPVSAAATPSAPMIRNASSGTASSADADTLKRVRALLDESEKRQQRELALRVAEVLRDVNAQRQADLVKIDRNLGQMENSLGVQVLQQRQQVNYLMRANQRQ